MKFIDILKDNGALVVALSVFYINLVGLSFNFTLFAYYGHNYADFADAGDFFLAAFKSPFALMYTIVLMMILSLVALRYFSGGLEGFKLIYRSWLVVFYGLILSASIPAIAAYFSASQVSGVPSFIESAMGGSTSVRLRCNAGAYEGDDQIDVTGRIVGRAGDLYLMDVDGFGVLIRRDCVDFIDSRNL